MKDSSNHLKIFAFFLFQEVLTVPIVILFFKTFEKKVAAVFAGALFLFLGFYILKKLIQKTEFIKKLTFWATLAHIFIGSIPLIVLRLLNWETDMTQIRIFSIPGHQYHYYAEKIFVILIIATFIDLIWLIIKKKRSS